MRAAARTLLLLEAAILLLCLPVPALAQAFTEYDIPTAGSRPFSITPGPDGALWFTESDGNQIGRITTQGVISEYRIPGTSSTPVWITSGPDGALWFTENNGNKIGRITTRGVISEY